ncbi:hypothetical protein E2C01_034298 [Portunus trituberculatus]|uniref:Uncharacterized protein n=1 Tax=Portunus trituberculatus TaxID=210409 RepID=A0A5B7F2G9_PORTR|nr:hypothetical protein [Portunus trituberculatus]
MNEKPNTGNEERKEETASLLPTTHSPTSPSRSSQHRSTTLFITLILPYREEGYTSGWYSGKIVVVETAALSA